MQLVHQVSVWMTLILPLSSSTMRGAYTTLCECGVVWYQSLIHLGGHGIVQHQLYVVKCKDATCLGHKAPFPYHQLLQRPLTLAPFALQHKYQSHYPRRRCGHTAMHTCGLP